MTTVAGLEHNGRVYMAGDSAVSWNSDDAIHAATHRKIVRRGGMLIGFAGALSACTVAAAGIHPEPYAGGSVREHVLCAIALPTRILLRESGNIDESCDLLIACGGRLWFAGVDGSVHGFMLGYGAIGSGSAYALGSLYSSRGRPAARVKRAVEAAVEHCSSVRGPVYVVSI